MTFRPKFDTLYKGPWTHWYGAGVGLRLEGMPTDCEAFIEHLMDYSCHPSATRRICDRIAANGFDLLTVMSALDFDEIAVVMRSHGVTMTIIDPQPDWEQRFHDGDFPSTFIPVHMREGYDYDN